MSKAEENVMHYGETKVGLEHYYRNEIDFPILGEMEEAALLMVSRVLSWEQQGASVILQTEADFYEKTLFCRFLDFRARYDATGRSRNICVKLTACSDEILRIQAEQGFTVSGRTSEMLVSEGPGPREFQTEERENEIRIHTGALEIVITKEPWNLTVFDRKGKRIFRQYTSRRTEEHAVMRYEHAPFGFLFDLKEGKSYASEQIEYGDSEHFYGFGEKFTDLDKRGQSVDLWNTNCLSCNTTRTYKNIPFFMSTAGYGIFMHTSHAINCNMGQHYNKAYCMLTDDSVIDYFFLYGPSMKEILPRYWMLTGAAPLPPKWSYGFWISKISYRTREEVDRLMRMFRERDIPCDVIHLDTDWYENPWICDYQFSRNRFPDPEAMLKEAEEKGFHITLWQMPYIEKGKEYLNPVYEEGYQKGYFACREDGTADFAHGLIDFSNPEAVKWYQEKLLGPLLEMGVSAIKVDFGESVPPFYHYANVPGAAMHNLYPLLYNRAVFEITERVHGKGEGIIWARSAWAGSQRYPVHWSGDSDVDFHALVTTVKAGLSFGLSGFPFWSHDVGGFNLPTTPDVYARWIEVGCFTSHIRAHGVGTREPWDFGPETEQIARDYLKLRYRLLPYIYSQSYVCTQTALPMFRALILEYQEDRNVCSIDDEYLFGDSFLVAPVMDETNEREVYLPEGIWTDFWSKEQIFGGRWIHVEAPLEILPLYLRENAMIPMGPDQHYVGEKETEELHWELYPVSGCSSFAVSDGRTTDAVLSMAASENCVTVQIRQSRVEQELRFWNIRAKAVWLHDREWPFVQDEKGILVRIGRIEEGELRIER